MMNTTPMSNAEFQERYDALRDMRAVIADQLDALAQLPPCRHTAIAKTELETASFRLRAAREELAIKNAQRTQAAYEPNESTPSD